MIKIKDCTFIGTPCQVAGLLNYIPNSLHKNLFTVSFICGGVPSNKFLKQNLNSYLKDAKTSNSETDVIMDFGLNTQIIK